MDAPIPSHLLAEVKTVYLERLHTGSAEEAEKLFSAAREDGVFYLDLAGHGDNDLCQLAASIYAMGREIFELSTEEKMGYDLEKIGPLKLNGYKPIGRHPAGIKGQQDGFESYSISRDAIMGLISPPPPAPPVLKKYHDELERLAIGCTGIAQLLLKTLSAAMKLPPGRSFEDFHWPNGSSADIVRVLRYATNAPGDNSFRVPQIPHTDVGSITMLFADSPGLQVLPEGTTEWLYVEPRPNHIIVNLGDAMEIWTNKFLRGDFHRVASLPGKSMKERYSVAFLMRPSLSTRLHSLLDDDSSSKLDSNMSRTNVTSEEWIKANAGPTQANDILI